MKMRSLTKEQISLIRINSISYRRTFWDNLSVHYRLPEDFIREFQDKVNWFYISWYQKLSEDFIRGFQDKVDWSNISYCQQLSEDFIREFQNKVDWSNISYVQNLSRKFIIEFFEKLYIKELLENSFISDEIKETIKLLS